MDYPHDTGPTEFWWQIYRRRIHGWIPGKVAYFAFAKKALISASDMRPVRAAMQFDPVTVTDLISRGAELAAHCRNCGHWNTLPASTMPEQFHNHPIPALEGVFCCSRCLSRNTCAMPIYREQKRPARSMGEGWIMPPGE